MSTLRQTGYWIEDDKMALKKWIKKKIPSDAIYYINGMRYLGKEAYLKLKDIALPYKAGPLNISCEKPKKIRSILMPALRNNYNDPEYGDSLEYTIFYPGLAGNYKVEFFDFKKYQEEHGFGAMNEHLLSLARKGEYDLFYFSLFVNDFDMGTIRKISEETATIAMNHFFDDHWRFNSFSRYWAPLFNYSVTSCKKSVEWYNAIGYPNAIFLPFAAEPKNYIPTKDSQEKYDVAFVGARHGNRESVMKYLSKNGIEVTTFGAGWKNGPIPHQKMVDVFANSKINLSFNNASIPFITNQIKCRMFDIPMCGGFQLTDPIDELPDIFALDEEIAVFRSREELVEKIKFYLQNDDLRAEIAKAGHERCLKDHTFEKRYSDLFSKIEQDIEGKAQMASK